MSKEYYLSSLVFRFTRNAVGHSVSLN